MMKQPQLRRILGSGRFRSNPSGPVTPCDGHRSFVLAHLGPSAYAAFRVGRHRGHRESSEERALPLIMSWCPDKRAVNTSEVIA